MRTLISALAVAAVVATVGAPNASADTPLLRQVKTMHTCLFTPTHRIRIAACGGQYASTLIAVNARRARYPVAVGIASASHQPIEACQCGSAKLIVSATAKARTTRRAFADWWKNPRTTAGRRLKGCLIGAAAALATVVAHYEASHGKGWDDSEALWQTFVGCGVGAVTLG